MLIHFGLVFLSLRSAFKGYANLNLTKYQQTNNSPLYSIKNTLINTLLNPNVYLVMFMKASDILDIFQ